MINEAHETTRELTGMLSQRLRELADALDAGSGSGASLVKAYNREPGREYFDAVTMRGHVFGIYLEAPR